MGSLPPSSFLFPYPYFLLPIYFFLYCTPFSLTSSHSSFFSFLLLTLILFPFPKSQFYSPFPFPLFFCFPSSFFSPPPSLLPLFLLPFAPPLSSYLSLFYLFFSSHFHPHSLCLTFCSSPLLLPLFLLPFLFPPSLLLRLFHLPFAPPLSFFLSFFYLFLFPLSSSLSFSYLFLLPYLLSLFLLLLFLLLLYSSSLPNNSFSLSFLWYLFSFYILTSPFPFSVPFHSILELTKPGCVRIGQEELVCPRTGGLS